MLGYALRQIREEKGKKQLEIAMSCGVTQAAVSRWEMTGTLPSAQIDCVLRALDVQVRDLHVALPRSLPGQTVKSQEMLDVWRDAVALGNLTPDAKLVLFAFALPHFVEPDSWIVEVAADPVADVLHMERDRVYDVWDEVTSSRFVDAIGSGGRIFKLKFPEN